MILNWWALCLSFDWEDKFHCFSASAPPHCVYRRSERIYVNDNAHLSSLKNYSALFLSARDISFYYNVHAYQSNNISHKKEHQQQQQRERERRRKLLIDFVGTSFDTSLYIHTYLRRRWWWRRRQRRIAMTLTSIKQHHRLWWLPAKVGMEGGDYSNCTLSDMLISSLTLHLYSSFYSQY